MHNPQLPHQHHIVRYCEPQHIDKGKVLDDAFYIDAKILAEAFYLDPEEQGLSLSCPEKIDSTLRLNMNIEQIRSVLPRMRAQLQTQLTIKKEGGLAILNVGQTIEKVKSHRRLRVLSIPLKGYESHCETRGYSSADNRVVPRILRKLVQATYKALE